MIFNGIEKSYIRVRRELFRPPSPPINFITHEKSNGGARVKKKRFTDVPLPVPIQIISPNKRIEELKEELALWLIHDEVKKLLFKDRPNRYYLAFYQGMELEEFVHMATGYIHFYLPEGYRFGEEQSINLTTEYNNFLVNGAIETPWTSSTTFAEGKTSYSIENNSGGKVKLNFNFVAGDILDIDYKHRRVTLNGESLEVAISFDSHWFELRPGYMSLRASQDTTLTYTERHY